MIILKNASVINLYPPKVENNTNIIIKGSTIAAKGSHPPQEARDIKIIDCSDKFVCPGLVCSHNHFYSVLARGIMADIKPAKDFIGILKNLWWRLDSALDEESLYYSGIIGALEAIKCGTTAVVDHNASPKYIRGSLSTLERSFKEAPLIEGAIGAHALFTLGNDTLKLLSEAIAETKRGIHIHAAEDRFDQAYSHHYHDLDIAERLESFGLLNEKAILAHGVHLNKNEIELINKHNSFLVHNPRSNMNNSVGYPDKLNLVDNLALGTDGIGSDMLEELKTAFYKSSDAKSPLTLNGLLRALQNGNLILKRYFGRNFGKVEKGYTADLVILNYNPPTPLVSENLAGHLLYGLSSNNVETVIINGQIVYEDGKFPFDTGVFYTKARHQAEKLWKRMNAGMN